MNPQQNLPLQGTGGKPSGIILMLRPLMFFDITAAELRRVESYGEALEVKGYLRSEALGDAPEALKQIHKLCLQFEPDNIYAKYAVKKVFRNEADFWLRAGTAVVNHVKHMCDQRLSEAIRLADELDIPIFFTPTKPTTFRMADRLRPSAIHDAKPVMYFHRHDGGTTYRLRLRMGGRLEENFSDRGLNVLGHNPGLFVLDGNICSLDEGFSGKLLLPFANKPTVEIPQHMENDYFRRFILKHVARVEVVAEGFDITDVPLQPQPIVRIEKAIDHSYVIALRFRYEAMTYTPDNPRNGHVTLTEKRKSFCFVRQLRDRQQETRIFDLMRRLDPRMTDGGDIRLPSMSATIDWLRRHAPELKEEGVDIVQPLDHRYYIGPLSVRQKDTWQGDWLQTDVTVIAVVFDRQLRLPFSTLRECILRGEQEYLLPTGEWLHIPDEWLERYAPLILTAQPSGDGLRRHHSQLEQALADSQPPSATVPTSTVAPDTSLPTGLRATLRPYQQEGYRWLLEHLLAQTGCCLSDEMGLGKTLQTIALLLKYKQLTKQRKPHPGLLFTEEEMQGGRLPSDTAVIPPDILPFRTSLVVAPASVVHNWRSELARFAPSLMVTSYTGDTTHRRDMLKALTRWDIVLTTYRTLTNDIAPLSQLSFGIIVFDESQAFKTAASQVHQAASSLQALHRVALSGTPVENSLDELWSLMNVLNPHLLGPANTFRHNFTGPILRQMEQKRTQLLRQLIAPYFLKRTKEQVLADLPERQDELVVCPLTPEEESRYAAELSRARNEFLDPQGHLQGRQAHLLAAIQRLRQLANSDGKLNIVFAHLDTLRYTQHKVLIFSEYVSLLERVGSEMQRRGWTFDLLTGQTTRREQVINHFQQTPDCQFFLISLKAGGVGLNLTAADYVFLLDPWWNRAAEEQAIARAHRIGQHQPVFVYRFVAAGTLEQQIITLQDRKQSLIDSVMPFVCGQPERQQPASGMTPATEGTPASSANIEKHRKT